MKIRQIVIAAATLAASSVFAAPAVNVNDADVVKIYMSGASALRATTAGLVANDICGTYAANNTVTVTTWPVRCQSSRARMTGP